MMRTDIFILKKQNSDTECVSREVVGIEALSAKLQNYMLGQKLKHQKQILQLKQQQVNRCQRNAATERRQEMEKKHGKTGQIEITDKILEINASILTVNDQR